LLNPNSFTLHTETQYHSLSVKTSIHCTLFHTDFKIYWNKPAIRSYHRIDTLFVFTLRTFSPVQVRWNRPLSLHRRSPVHQQCLALSQRGWPEVRLQHHCTAICYRSHQWHSDPDHFHRSYTPCGHITYRTSHQKSWQFSKKYTRTRQTKRRRWFQMYGTWV